VSGRNKDERLPINR